MQIEEFDYELPAELIAQHPTQVRSESRLLEVRGSDCVDRVFSEVVDFFRPGDLLVINNTRVLKARLFGTKDTGGEAELLLERMLAENQGLFQIRVSKPLKEGRRIRVGDTELQCEGRRGQFYILRSEDPLEEVLERYGSIPLPPYIERSLETLDQERYQTVFSREPGAVAAPTAGLHFDESVLASLKSKGVDVAEVTLHVGAGTFQPVRGALENHVMHEEWYEVPVETAAKVRSTQTQGGRIVAVGTTVVRTLESVAKENGGQVMAAQGATRLFIKPGFEFLVVDCLITNFHLPRSTLMMLVCAFAGGEKVMAAYKHAVASRYRFFSYGDAMWLERDV